MIKLSELLKLRGLTEYKEIKIVRHLDNRIDIKRLYRLGYFDAYQCGQSKDVFNCKRIISTIGEENNRAVFCGIYDVISKRPGLHSDMPAGYPYPDQYQDGGFLYTLNKLSGFDDFENRVVIDWGPAALAWHQWFYDNDKDIFEILPSGYVMEWPGYSNVILNHHELSLVIKNPKSNPKWFSSLSSVGGVYLILDLNDGKQYMIGYWQRWHMGKVETIRRKWTWGKQKTN
jgi:hypothetical protein